MRKKFASSSVSGLNFIQDKQGSILATLFVQESEKSILRNLNSADTLNTFNNYGRHFIRQSIGKGLLIIEWNKFNCMSRIKGRDYLGIVSCRHCTGSTAVEGLPESNDLVPTSNK